LSVFSYAAAQAYIRARLTRLLDRATWGRLLEAETLAQIGQLMRPTALASAVTRDGAIRLQLLRGEAASAGRILARFLPQRAREVVSWYNRRYEIENLKTILRTVHYHVERARALPSLIPLREPTLRWEELLEAGSVVSVIDRIRASPYHLPLDHALERYREEGRLFYLEIALDLFFFQRLVRLIKSQSGSEAEDALRFLGRWIAGENLLWAYRYRVHGRLTPEEIINFTLHRAFSAGLDTVRRVALGAPFAAEAERMGFRLSPNLSEAEAFAELELQAARERFQLASEVIGRQLYHLGGVLACLWLLEGEVHDLAAIVEGKTIGLSSAEISRRMLRAA
jgi:V/A-type H+/Na+-transporting ATPase subunit C